MGSRQQHEALLRASGADYCDVRGKRLAAWSVHRMRIGDVSRLDVRSGLEKALALIGETRSVKKSGAHYRSRIVSDLLM
jgi:hypothetical protein